MQLWEQLKRSQVNINAGKVNAKSLTFMQAFNQYNSSLNNALIELQEQPQPIEGRSKEIEMLYAVLERPKTPVALLLGQAGVGKTALVEEFAKQLNSGKYETALNYEYLLIALRLGSLSSLGNHNLQSALANLMTNLGQFEKLAQKVLNKPNLRIVLFIDEVHMLVTIFGPGTKVGGDVMKDVLARSPIRIIAATTRREYDSTIIVDKPFSERFKQIEMAELAPDIVKKICYSWWDKIAPDCPKPDEELLDRVIKANAMYRSDSAEPRKTLDILEDFVSYSRRTRKKVSSEVVDKIFKDRYEINLTLNIEPNKAFDNVNKYIQGQPHAMFVMRRAIRSLVYNLDPLSNKPMLTALLSGPTGVGKSETVKRLADALYPGEKVLFNINMPDFKTAEHEQAFRKRLGEQVRHTPNSIILFDEFEKAHDSVLDSMLSILDEGLVTFETINREGNPEVNTVSLRNTIIFATTNAGTKVFENDAKFKQRNKKEEMDINNLSDQERADIETILKNLRKYLLSEGMKPEMLNRFQRIVPYRGLDQETFANIAEKGIDNMIESFRNLKNIHVIKNDPMQWDKDMFNCYASDVAVYIAFIKAKADDTSSGGARSIKQQIDSTIRDAIIDAISENPEHNKFKIEVSKDTKIYNHKAQMSEGGIVVHAVD